VERLVSSDLAAVILANSDGTCRLSRHNASFGYVAEPGKIGEIAVDSLTIVERLHDEVGPVIIDRPAQALGPAGSVLGARMQFAGKRVGMLIVESATPGFFTPDHGDRLGAVADQAGAVLSNSQLASRVSELAAAEERQRLAPDLPGSSGSSAPAPDLGFPASFHTLNEHQQLHIDELPDVRSERAHFCLRLGDFADLAMRAVELGIVETETWGKPRRLPSGEMQLFVRDPSGNLIELSCDADQPVDPAFFEHDVVEPEPQYYRRTR
jgi:catechol 2,3-dioxygenase-like lactoylglutathione lyase family enzyme